MIKKLIAACMAIAAFAAFAIPSTASATNRPTLTETNGALPTGTLIKATQLLSSRLYETNGPGVQLTCTTGEMTGTLTKNSGGNVEGEITFATFGGTGGQAAGEPHTECTGSFGANASVTPQTPMCIRSTTLMATDEFQVTGGKCGENKAVTFTIAPTGLTPCTYHSTGALVGHYLTHHPATPQDAVMTVEPTQTNGFTKTAGGSFLCPNSSELEMSMTLETDTKVAEPLYIETAP